MLIKCTECIEKINKESEVCPKCGCQTSVSIEKKKNEKQEQTYEIVKKIISYLCSEKV